MSDQIRKLKNKVRIVGKLAEVDKFNRITCADGIEAISFTIGVQFGETAAEVRKVKGFVKKLIKDGEENVNYTNAENLIEKGIPMTKDKENATELVLGGSIEHNEYMRENQLIETYDLNCNFITPRTNEEYTAEAEIEGYIKQLLNETSGKGEDMMETGRKRMLLLTTNFRNEAVEIKNIVVRKDVLDSFRQAKGQYFEDVYGVGKTATLYLRYLPSERKTTTSTTNSGFGEVRVTEGGSYCELVVTGAPSLPYDEDDPKALTTEIIQKLNEERKIKLEAIKNDVKNTTPKKATPEVKASDFTEVADPEDLPF